MPPKILQLGSNLRLSNGTITRVDLDTSHYYFHDGVFHLGLTTVLDIGAPVPKQLLDYLRYTDAKESMETLEVAAARGSKLHDALDRLAQGLALPSAEYHTAYEKAAIASFIRFMRFLQPQKYVTEVIVSDPKIRVSGTLDFKGYVDARRLLMLLEPTKYLRFEYTDDGDYSYEVQDKWAPMLAGKPQLIKVVMDWKFTGRSTYNHKVQVAGYAEMNRESYKDEEPVARKFTWRFSPAHKFKFDLNESLYGYDSFVRIYDTAMEFLANAAGRKWTGFPEPPELVVYPETFVLFEPIKKGVKNDRKKETRPTGASDKANSSNGAAKRVPKVPGKAKPAARPRSRAAKKRVS